MRALPIRILDGAGNNRRLPDWGAAEPNDSRVAPARYADGLGEPVAGPDGRYLSNRIFNDSHQNLFSERGVTQWVFAWGQFIDHTIGRRDEAGDEANIPFGADDPLEEFTNTVGHIPFTRSAAAPGTGVAGAALRSIAWSRRSPSIGSGKILVFATSSRCASSG